MEPALERPMMEGNHTLLDEALESWKFTREGVLAEAESIPAEHYGFRPTPRSRSVAELLRHIAESALMAAGELTNPKGDFCRQSYPEFLLEYASHVAGHETKDELIDLLRRAHADGEARFRDVGELFLLQHIRRFDGVQGTRLAWVWHAIDHESYHRGQLALYVRSLGLVPALTRQIHGDA